MANDPPTEEVIKMKKDNVDKDDIAKNLEEKGFNQQQIVEAMNQVDIKKGVEAQDSSQMQESMMSSPEEDIPVPTPTRMENPQPSPTQAMPQQQTFQVQQPLQQPRYNYDDVQEIVESVVEEKWQTLISGIGDLAIWKSKTEDDLSSVKQEILRVEERIDNLQRSVLGKVDEYNKNISKVNTEVQALEKVFQKIMEPFTQNVKELSRLTKDLKASPEIKTSIRKNLKEK